MNSFEHVTDVTKTQVPKKKILKLEEKKHQENFRKRQARAKFEKKKLVTNKRKS